MNILERTGFLVPLQMLPLLRPSMNSYPSTHSSHDVHTLV